MNDQDAQLDEYFEQFYSVIGYEVQMYPKGFSYWDSEESPSRVDLVMLLLGRAGV